VRERPVYRSELSPIAFLERSAAVFPDRTAVVHGERRYTYAELGRRVRRLASALRARGLARGERVAVLSPNTPAMLEVHSGIPAAGGVMVPINTRLSAGEVGFILEHSGARFAIVDRELGPLLDGAATEPIVVDDTGEPDDPYEVFLGTGDPGEPPLPVDDEEDVISINYTSGTTGTPKGVMVTHRGAFLNALGEVIEAGLSYDSVYLWTLPMFHCNGWGFPWAVTAIAGRHVCLRRVEPALIWDLLEREGVTHFCGAPTVAISLVHDASARRLAWPVTALLGGAPPSPTLIERMAELNLRPLHVYGLTETYGPMTVCVWHDGWDALPADERARLLARQGWAYLTHDPVRVLDTGEVGMRGNNVMRGYYRDEQTTERAFEGGWFHSGDIGVQHDDGAIELRDRAKDIIVSGGENISTIEVEQAVVAHPAVLECAVVAMPDEKWGERPKAFVDLKNGQRATEREIIDFCRERLAHFKCPSAVEFGPLPKTSTGKIQKYVLREREWARRERRIN
jgi:acyl-CoA synthetase (AMP-forming)/AMP-acid ligase II